MRIYHKSRFWVWRVTNLGYCELVYGANTLAEAQWHMELDEEFTSKMGWTHRIVDTQRGRRQA